MTANVVDLADRPRSELRCHDTDHGIGARPFSEMICEFTMRSVNRYDLSPVNAALIIDRFEDSLV